MSLKEGSDSLYYDDLKIGSLLFCEILGGFPKMEPKICYLNSSIVPPLISKNRSLLFFCDTPLKHVGLFIGNGKIIELNGDGKICEVNLEEFINVHWIRTGDKIETLIDTFGEIISFPEAVKKAKEMVGKNNGYNLFDNNCYKFIWSCIMEDDDSSCFSYHDLRIRILLNFHEISNFKRIDFKNENNSVELVTGGLSVFFKNFIIHN